MKKRILKRLITISFSLLIFINIAAYAASTDMNLNINLAPGSNNPSHMSVLDIYNIKIFDYNKQERTEKIQEQNEKENEELIDNLFQSTEVEEEKIDGELKEVVQYNLFSEAKVSKQIQYEEQEGSKTLIIVLGIVFCCLVTAYLTRLYYNKKSKGEEIYFEY